MKKLNIIVILFLIIISCKTTTPIIIRERPKIEFKDKDKTVNDYKKMAEWKLKIIAYIDELINQIKHKTPYKDLRKEDKK